MKRLRYLKDNQVHYGMLEGETVYGLGSLFDDQTIEIHLRAIMSNQQPDGAWPVNWPAVSPASVFENQAMFTIQNLKTLKAYGRL